MICNTKAIIKLIQVQFLNNYIPISNLIIFALPKINLLIIYFIIITTFPFNY